jgi:hypothetical protein
MCLSYGVATDLSVVRQRKAEPIAVAEEAIAPEDYLREHAELLRVYARHTNPKASMRLIESAQHLEWAADKARNRRLVESTERGVRRRSTMQLPW